MLILSYDDNLSVILGSNITSGVVTKQLLRGFAPADLKKILCYLESHHCTFPASWGLWVGGGKPGYPRGVPTLKIQTHLDSRLDAFY